MVDHLTRSERLTPEQKIHALGEASKHPKAGLHFKSAGLLDLDEVETLKHVVILQSNKLIGAAWKEEETEKA